MGRGWNDLARGHSVLGIVSDRAARVVVHTAAQDDVEAVVLAVPHVGAAAIKAFVAFTPYDEAPRSISALDEDGAVVAMHDLRPADLGSCRVLRARYRRSVPSRARAFSHGRPTSCRCMRPVATVPSWFGDTSGA